MLTGGSCLPYDLEPYLALRPFLVEDNFAYDKSQDTLSVGGQCRGGVPDPREVQARSIETDHKTGIAKADFGDQLLEALTIHVAGTRITEVIVDDLHALMGPSQTYGAVD